MDLYPTKEAILDQIDKETFRDPIALKAIEITRLWKKEHFDGQWRKADDDTKKDAIKKLIEDIYDGATQNPRMLHFLWDIQPRWFYLPDNHLINGTSNSISIISALHELGHAIYGSSELLACAFSVNIFQEAFPNQYNKLKWNGHLLVR